jgi:FlaA1/EpsC-like NDP-sugar epimerase
LFIRNRYFFLADVLLLPLAAYAAFAVRLDDVGFVFGPQAQYGLSFAVLALAAMVVTPLVFARAGVYGRYWRFASLEDLLLLLAAVLVSGLIAAFIGRAAAWFWPAVLPVPWGALVVFGLLAAVAAGLPRLAGRLFRSYAALHDRAQADEPVLIVGAGETGDIIARELMHKPRLGMQVVGFIDDDSAKLNMKLRGVPVLGARQDIPAVARRYDIRTVIIAMPSSSGRTIRDVVDICRQAGLETKTMPGLPDLIDGSVSVSKLRNVEIEDLLRREPIRTDLDAVRQLLRGKRVLVTGGGGSIGGELCRQVLRCEPAQLVILGHGENSVFQIAAELRRNAAAGDKIAEAVADVRFPDRLRAVFQQYRPEVVFHAAAHKHVPLMESNAPEAITNNILGTRNLLDASEEAGVQRFVMISTDKAVNPTSIMGASKRAAELAMLQAARRTGRPYVAVRFGNVLGSRGSVVLTFKQQIASGGPVTVTHPDMTRYFMTIPEAVQLVLQAAVLGQGGEIFMLDMGEPVRIFDLARDMIRLSGLEEGRDIDIVFTGMRPGEKLREELFLPSETYQQTRHDKVFIARHAGNAVPADLDAQLAALKSAAGKGDTAAIVRLLRTLIPEFAADWRELAAAPLAKTAAAPSAAPLRDTLLPSNGRSQPDLPANVQPS